MIGYCWSIGLWTGINLVVDLIWVLEDGLNRLFWGEVGKCRVLWVYLTLVWTRSLCSKRLRMLGWDLFTFDLVEGHFSMHCPFPPTCFTFPSTCFTFPNIFSPKVLQKNVDSVVFSHSFCIYIKAYLNSINLLFSLSNWFLFKNLSSFNNNKTHTFKLIFWWANWFSALKYNREISDTWKHLSMN